MDWTTLFFGFKGRINRAKLWLASLIYILMLIAFVVVYAVALGDFDQDRIGDIVGTSLLFTIICSGLFLILIWSSTATAIKRLHDRNKSGWWILVFSVVPAIIGIVADTTSGSASFALNMASAALSIWGFVELACLRGTEGPNEYGPDPLGAPAIAVQA